MSLGQGTIDDYLSYCHTNLSQNTMVVVTANLRKLLVHFLNLDLSIKIVRHTTPERDKTSLTKNEMKSMFRCTSGNPLESAIIRTLYYTGVRCSELINLNIDDIDFERLQITIKHGKGDKTRIVNMTSDCAHTIQRWLQVRPKPKGGHEDALFISSRKQRVTTSCVRKIVKRNASMAGIPRNVYPHKFRITNITHMAEAGMSVSEIQTQSGHLDTKTLIGYIQHTSSRIRKEYDRTFSDVGNLDSEPGKATPPQIPDGIEYKKIDIQKYLDGEIDTSTLRSI